MLDADAGPFDPTAWSCQEIQRHDVPRFAPRVLLMTSRKGTHLRVRADTRKGYGPDPRPIWFFENAINLCSIGWVSAVSPDPVQDLHAALVRGENMKTLSLPIERWLLERGVRGGTWAYFGFANILYDVTGRDQIHDLPDIVSVGKADMFPMSRFVLDDDRWMIHSAFHALRCVLPMTRHGAMERLAVLRDL